MELDEKEVRIGNLVYLVGIDYDANENAIADLNELDIKKVDLEVLRNISEFDGTTDYELYTGIPITDEGLLKLGFVKIGNGEFGIVPINDNYVYTVSFLKKEIRFFIASYMDVPPSVVVQYVHQLQNLYFALTGEELELD